MKSKSIKDEKHKHKQNYFSTHNPYTYVHIIFLFVLFSGWVFVHYCCSLEREAIFHGKTFWSHKYDACQMAFIQNDVCLRGGQTNLTMSNLVGIDCYANSLCIVTSVVKFERAEVIGCSFLHSFIQQLFFVDIILAEFGIFLENYTIFKEMNWETTLIRN